VTAAHDAAKAAREVLRSAKSTNEPTASIAYQELLKSQPRPQYRSGVNTAGWDDNVPITTSGFAAVTAGTSLNVCQTPVGALTFSGADLPLNQSMTKT
jgi:hypothetical protein